MKTFWVEWSLRGNVADRSEVGLGGDTRTATLLIPAIKKRGTQFVAFATLSACQLSLGTGTEPRGSLIWCVPGQMPLPVSYLKGEVSRGLTVEADPKHVPGYEVPRDSDPGYIFTDPNYSAASMWFPTPTMRTEKAKRGVGHVGGAVSEAGIIMIQQRWLGCSFHTPTPSPKV